MSRSVLLVGFRTPEFEAFREEGVDVGAWIKVTGRGEAVHHGPVETYAHHSIVRCEIDAPFRADMGFDLRRALRDAAFDTFRRHWQRIALERSMSMRSWTNTENLFWIAANQYFDLLTRRDIGTVIFCNFPHEGSLIVLYHLARLTGRDTIIATQSQFPARIWITREIGDFGTFDTVAGEGRPEPVPEAPQVPFYMKRKGKWVRAFDTGIRVVAESLKLAAKVVTLRVFFDPEGLDRNMNRLLTARHRFRLGEPSPAHIDRDVDLDAPFVYFPLHLQPEMTTDTWGLEYGDQLRALEELSAALPEGMLIYAKENPAQSRFMRELSFYRRLKSLPNVRYLSFEVPSFDLIRRCACLATISGTAGWEAAQLGKGAIHFGVAWYARLPGVWRWKGPETLAAALAWRGERAPLEAAFADLTGKLYSGVVDPYYAAIVEGYDPRAAGREAVRAIVSVMNGRDAAPAPGPGGRP